MHAVKHLVRTFVGLRCGPSARARLHAAAARLAEGDHALKLQAVEDLHITLQFLGATPQEDLAMLGRALEEAAAGFAPLEVTYRGLGAFPHPERPRVIWAGVEEPDGGDRLADLARAIGRAMRAVGYRPEKRAFHAHVTVARVHSRPGARALEALVPPPAGPPPLDLGGEILSDLKLMLSDPGNYPYHYIDLTTVPLEG